MSKTPLTQNIHPDSPPLNFVQYRERGGYRAVEHALRNMAPEDVTQLVEDAKLRGRGGAGFPTGTKWGFVPMGSEAPSPKYLVVNADEMEPGTFKDRYLLEGDPHQMIESTIVSSYAVGADVAYIFLRWAYRKSERRLRRAIAEAKAQGFLGQNILGSAYSLDVHVHVSAGRYMCGEETGLLNALEGKRATPRQKPPYPQSVGLWGKPTVVNNVETLCNVPHIINHGAQWYQALGRGTDSGTKLYGVSGKVKQPGVWELPMGTPLGELIDRHAGGMRDHHEFAGALPGGASTDFLVSKHWDTPLDFESVAEAGSRLGTGCVIVMDDRTCPVGFLLNLERFFALESCGWCTPCREGLPWTAKLLQSIEEGQGQADYLDHLEHHVRGLGMGCTFCALAPGAMAPLGSGLRYFRSAFERHIEHRTCPWGVN